jgi:hypothetical protein
MGKFWSLLLSPFNLQITLKNIPNKITGGYIGILHLPLPTLSTKHVTMAHHKEIPIQLQRATININLLNFLFQNIS